MSDEALAIGDEVRFAKKVWKVQDVGGGGWQSGLVLISNDFDTRAVPAERVTKIKK